jgi:drug/metabolite transporter (DMT)-like permease
VRANERWKGTAAAAITVVTWAAAFPAIRVGLEGYGPLSLGLARLLFAAAGLGVAALFVRPALPPRALWARVIAAGLLGQALYQALLMIGELQVPAGTASILIATAPVFSVLAARWGSAAAGSRSRCWVRPCARASTTSSSSRCRRRSARSARPSGACSPAPS